jgi:hypothetical protein
LTWSASARLVIRSVIFTTAYRGRDGSLG